MGWVLFHTEFSQGSLRLKESSQIFLWKGRHPKSALFKLPIIFAVRMKTIPRARFTC